MKIKMETMETIHRYICEGTEVCHALSRFCAYYITVHLRGPSPSDSAKGTIRRCEQFIDGSFAKSDSHLNKMEMEYIHFIHHQFSESLEQQHFH